MQVVWNQEYPVSSFLTDSRKKLGLHSLLNLLQDAAWIHATHLGHGFEDTLKKGMIWVLTRQKLVMESWPEWGDAVQIRTWIRPTQGALAVRDFEIRVGGRTVGASTTSWLMMDMETRRPSKGRLTESDTGFRTDYRLPFDAMKLELRGDFQGWRESDRKGVFAARLRLGTA